MVIDHLHNPHLGGRHVELDVQKGLRKADECGHMGDGDADVICVQCDQAMVIWH